MRNEGYDVSSSANSGQGEVTLEEESQTTWQLSRCSQCGDINNFSA